MKNYEIIDKIEEIQDRNYDTYPGSNEAELHAREDIAAWIESLYEMIDDKNRRIDYLETKLHNITGGEE